MAVLKRPPLMERDVAAEELSDVGQVASDVGQRTGAGSALVPPAHGRVGAEAVVGPVAAAEVQHLAEGSVPDQVPDVGDAGRAAEGEADPGDRGRVAGGFGHGPGVFQGVAQRLFAQHVLAGGEEALDDFTVQRVGDDDADDVDVIGFGDGLP